MRQAIDGALRRRPVLNTNQFLNKVAQRHDLQSDYQIAKKIQVSRQQISLYRKGATFGDNVAIRVAALLDMDPAYVLACTAAERSKEQATKDAWERAAKRLATAATLLLVVTLSATPDYAKAAPLSENARCVLCKISAAIRQWLFPSRKATCGRFSFA